MQLSEACSFPSHYEGTLPPSAPSKDNISSSMSLVCELRFPLDMHLHQYNRALKDYSIVLPLQHIQMVSLARSRLLLELTVEQ